MGDETPTTEDTVLDGRAALITGASAGIGRETALALAREGADVSLLARREDRLRAVADEVDATHGVDALILPTDVTDETQVEAAVESTAEAFGGIDVVVNNAGTGPSPDLDVEELPTEQYRTVMGVNVDGMFFVTRAALPRLRAAAGTLIFVGSFAGHYPRPGSPVYAASKWWTRGFALSLAGQVGDDDVAVTVVNPSEVRTAFGREFREESDLQRERFEPREVTEPGEVAEAIVFAARQQRPNAVAELDLYRRDKFVGF